MIYGRSELPVTCPYCSGRFAIDVEPPERGSETYCCKRCEHIWKARKDIPRRCPNCGSDKWDMEVMDYSCKRCGYQWESYKKKKRCPRCGTDKWDMDPENQDGKDACLGDVSDVELTRYRDAGMNVVDIALYCNIPLLPLLEFYRNKGWGVD